MAAMTSFAGAKVQAVTQQRVVRSRQTVRCMASSNEAQNRRQLLGLGAALAAAALAPAAKADLVSDLLEKSKTNKAENDKKRLLASYANVERSRTVSDGSCAVPNNFLGCGENPAFIKVKFISDSAEKQCAGKEPGKCASGWSK